MKEVQIPERRYDNHDREERRAWDSTLNTDIGTHEDREFDYDSGRDWGFDKDRDRPYGQRGRSGSQGGQNRREFLGTNASGDREQNRGRSRQWREPGDELDTGDVYGYGPRAGADFPRQTNLDDFARRGRGDDFGLYESRGPAEDDWMRRFDRERDMPRGGGQRGARQRGRGRGFQYNWEGQPHRQNFRYVEHWNVAGPYQGVGPKGYQRSDAIIQDDVCEMLTIHGQIDARQIEVQVQNGEVTLRGEVNRRREKYLAEDMTASLPGVRDVHNQLRVNKG